MQVEATGRKSDFYGIMGISGEMWESQRNPAWTDWIGIYHNHGETLYNHKGYILIVPWNKREDS